MDQLKNKIDILFIITNAFSFLIKSKMKAKPIPDDLIERTGPLS
jgi:hypothetical protein